MTDLSEAIKESREAIRENAKRVLNLSVSSRDHKAETPFLQTITVLEIPSHFSSLI